MGKSALELPWHLTGIFTIPSFLQIKELFIRESADIFLKKENIPLIFFVFF
jgi:hypothetical protein